MFSNIEEGDGEGVSQVVASAQTLEAALLGDWGPVWSMVVEGFYSKWDPSRDLTVTPAWVMVSWLWVHYGTGSLGFILPSEGASYLLPAEADPRSP